MTDHDLLAFVSVSIRSVWALELLLFLKRNSGQSWDADSLIRELRSSSVVIAEALASLESAGMIRNDGATYRYDAASSKLDEIVGGLEHLYAEKPLSVVKAIVDRPSEQLRIFSDAFKLKD